MNVRWALAQTSPAAGPAAAVSVAACEITLMKSARRVSGSLIVRATG